MIRFKLVYRLEVIGKENIPKDSNYIIEFIDNRTIIIDPGRRTYMTNFHVFGTTLDETGHIDFNSVENFGMGLERYNIIIDNYLNGKNDINTKGIIIDDDIFLAIYTITLTTLLIVTP